jgi:hypothetical protein
MPPPVAGTLDQFYAQPSTGGGKALTFEAPGTQYIGIVTRPIGDGDIQQQTDTQNRPATFKDGRPKFVMKVPLQMQPSPAYTDGLAQWYVKGAARDELVRAMAEAGAPEGPPEAGSVITVTMTGTRPSGAGMNPTKLFHVHYRRPQGAPPAPAAAAPVTSTATGQPVTHQQVVPDPNNGYRPAPPPIYAVNTNAQAQGQPEPARVNGGQPPQYVPPPAPAPVAVPPPPAPAPVDLSPEQRALLAQLTGQPA